MLSPNSNLKRKIPESVLDTPTKKTKTEINEIQKQAKILAKQPESGWSYFTFQLLEEIVAFRSSHCLPCNDISCASDEEKDCLEDFRDQLSAFLKEKTSEFAPAPKIERFKDPIQTWDMEILRCFPTDGKFYKGDVICCTCNDFNHSILPLQARTCPHLIERHGEKSENLRICKILRQMTEKGFRLMLLNETVKFEEHTVKFNREPKNPQFRWGPWYGCDCKSFTYCNADAKVYKSSSEVNLKAFGHQTGRFCKHTVKIRGFDQIEYTHLYAKENYKRQMGEDYVPPAERRGPHFDHKYWTCSCPFFVKESERIDRTSVPTCKHIDCIHQIIDGKSIEQRRITYGKKNGELFNVNILDQGENDATSFWIVEASDGSSYRIESKLSKENDNNDTNETGGSQTKYESSDDDDW